MFVGTHTYNYIWTVHTAKLLFASECVTSKVDKSQIPNSPTGLTNLAPGPHQRKRATYFYCKLSLVMQQKETLTWAGIIIQHHDCVVTCCFRVIMLPESREFGCLPSKWLGSSCLPDWHSLHTLLGLMRTMPWFTLHCGAASHFQCPAQ